MLDIDGMGRECERIGVFRLKIRTIYPPSAALIPIQALLEAGLALVGCAGAVRSRTEELRKHFGVRHVFLVSSGKAALLLILDALHDLKVARREVVLPAYTCYSVPSAVVKAGLEPMLADVSRDSFGFDETCLTHAVSSTTLCVVASHLLGNPENLEMVSQVARSVGAFVVEDAAQAMGVRREGKLLGTVADVGFFSLGRGKNLTCGGGGVILTDDDAIAERIGSLWNGLRELSWIENAVEFVKAVLLAVFVRPWLYWIPSAIPQLRLGETHFEHDFRLARLSNVQGALLCGWLKRLESSNRARVRKGSKIAQVLRLNKLSKDAVPLRFPWLLRSSEEKRRVLQWSQEDGLGVSGMYPSALNGVPELQERFAGQEYPNAVLLSERLVTIPTHELIPPTYLAKLVRLQQRVAQSGDEGR